MVDPFHSIIITKQQYYLFFNSIYVVHNHFFSIVHWNKFKVFVNAYHKWVVGRSCDLFIYVYISIVYIHNTTPYIESSRLWRAIFTPSGVELNWKPDGKSVIAKATHFFFFLLCYESNRWMWESQSTG